jgi:hypothetical protein
MEEPMKKCTLFAVIPALMASAAYAQMQVSTGLDYSQGKYGSTVTTDQWTMPVVAKYEGTRWMVKASLPYVWIHNVNPNSRGENLPCGGAVNTPNDVDGIGDLVTSGSYSVVQSNGLIVDVGGKIKFATGDKDKCLSTGKNDYSVFTDIAKQFGNFTAFGGLGWTAKGDPEFQGTTTNYRNPFYANIGGGYKLTSETTVGASYDFRQRLTATGHPISEMTLFLTHKFTPNLKVQGYAIKGFSDASPDFGVGGLVSVGF